MSQEGKKKACVSAQTNTMDQHITILTTVTPEIPFQKTSNSLVHPPSKQIRSE